MHRLSRAGFKSEFVRRAILPDWWEETCAQDPNLLPDIEIRVARFLELPLATVRDAGAALTAPSYSSAQLRRVRDLDPDRLAPAIHSGMRIAAAAVRSLRNPAPRPVLPPPDGLAWREQIERTSGAMALDSILTDMWVRGIPVVSLDVLPTPSFQGAACIVQDRPVILLGHKYDAPGRVAFLVAHEAGHIAAGDCTPDQPVVEEEEEVRDDASIERSAERYAIRALVGGDSIPLVDREHGVNFKKLATVAAQLERTSGADAGIIIFAWAARTGDYTTASMAVQALYRGSGARRLLRQHFTRHIDLDAATDGDAALLRCVYGEPERDAAVG